MMLLENILGVMSASGTVGGIVGGSSAVLVGAAEEIGVAAGTLIGVGLGAIACIAEELDDFDFGF